MVQNAYGHRIPLGQPERSPGILKTLLFAPFNISLAILTTFLSSLRPYAPKLVPLVIFSSFIPITIFLSTCAGLVVWSSLSVSWETPLYLQYGDGGNPYAYAHLPPLTSSQRYDISVELVLPCTDANLALGNFMTALTLSTSSANKTLEYVRRPTIAPKPTSYFIFSKTTKRVTVPLLESFVAPKSRLAALVEVGRHDRWTLVGAGEGREVSVASAKLRGLVVPHGIRGIAIRFPLLSSLAAAGLFFNILALFLGMCVLPLVLPEASEDFEDHEVHAQGPPVPVKAEPEPREPSPPSLSSVSRSRERERRSRRKRRSRSAKGEEEQEEGAIPVGDFQVKTEEEPEEILISTTGESSSNRGLRRRTSRPSGIERANSPSTSTSP
ncbi:hypothetical protein D9619_003128 [Psilocybe cf. subviscida]|uniref:Seipin n=1 Tax=Psilocybe cf. subviscida TaxID=2480587 RepID=A0A8H5AXK9_9AGAR|nr:hypothetical protein D9619_003128 [Psilocybe cf. subviscida]